VDVEELTIVAPSGIESNMSAYVSTQITDSWTDGAMSAGMAFLPDGGSVDMFKSDNSMHWNSYGFGYQSSLRSPRGEDAPQVQSCGELTGSPTDYGNGIYSTCDGIMACGGDVISFVRFTEPHGYSSRFMQYQLYQGDPIRKKVKSVGYENSYYRVPEDASCGEYSLRATCRGIIDCNAICGGEAPSWWNPFYNGPWQSHCDYYCANCTESVEYVVADIFYRDFLVGYDSFVNVMTHANNTFTVAGAYVVNRYFRNMTRPTTFEGSGRFGGADLFNW
jgi:hypothetical protein